jgi:hypothetical protein
VNISDFTKMGESLLTWKLKDQATGFPEPGVKEKMNFYWDGRSNSILCDIKFTREPICRL